MFKFLLGMLYFYVAKAISCLKHGIQRKKAQVKIPGRITKIEATSIPKFLNQLVKPPVYKPFTIKTKLSTTEKDENVSKKKVKGHLYFVDVSQFTQQILPPGFPETKVWGYGGLIKDPITGKITYSRSAPGATFEAVRGIPAIVKWINSLAGSHLFAVDPTLHWANPNNMPMDMTAPFPSFPPGFPDAQAPVPMVTHLHGGEVPSIFDGHPDAWFTKNGKKGPAFVTSLYCYPNNQEPTTLWYHDHALGITRLNVYAGLAGFYLLREADNCKNDNCSKKKLVLPDQKYEFPIVIQDRSFNTDGSFFEFNSKGINPDIHPYWRPEFFGDTIMVNGKVWPNLNIERRQYRFRLLNGSNARFYNLYMSNGMKFIQIGTDGGFLPAPVKRDTILIAPGERADVLVDFSDIIPGTKITLLNNANAPFPDGLAPDDNVGQIMQFYVPADSPAAVKPPTLPGKLNDIPDFIPDSPKRTLTLNEVTGLGGPLEVLLNGQKWAATISELPRVGSTEEWVIANLTMDTHPIHLHLVQFQILNRQEFRADDYRMLWEGVNGVPPLQHQTTVVPVDDFLIGDPIDPEENEKGWKDTIRMNPNQVTRIRVRFAPQDIPVGATKPGKNFYPFDPTLGPGYVWHCHILDHEDNEMMRPYKVKP